MKGGEVKCHEDLVVEVFGDQSMGAGEVIPILSAGGFPGFPVGGGPPPMPPIMPEPYLDIQERDILPIMEEGQVILITAGECLLDLRKAKSKTEFEDKILSLGR
jgi:hypothetical protein